MRDPVEHPVSAGQRGFGTSRASENEWPRAKVPTKSRQANGNKLLDKPEAALKLTIRRKAFPRSLRRIPSLKLSVVFYGKLGFSAEMPIMPSHDDGHRVHVLHVDDDPDCRFLVQEAARRANPTLVLFGVNGYPQAVAYLSGDGCFADRQQYPVPIFILLDYALNGHTGVDMVRWLRGDNSSRSLPVVVFSDSDSPERVALCYREGVNHYLVKPRSFDRLENLVQLLAECFASDPPGHSLLVALPEYRSPTGR